MDILEVCVSAIKEKFPDVVGIWLFGSTATGSDVAGSDVDLAILSNGNIERVELWHVAQLIARKIGKDIDIVDLLPASTVLRAQVVRNGQRIYCADKLKCDTFETEALTDYLRFSEQRHELLKDIESRGKVFGDGR